MVQEDGLVEALLRPARPLPDRQGWLRKNAAARAEKRAHGDDCLRRPRRTSLPPERCSRHGQPRLSHNYTAALAFAVLLGRSVRVIERLRALSCARCLGARAHVNPVLTV